MRNLAPWMRILTHQPRYAILAVVTLAVGIGVNSAMFGLLDAVYFRPLPIADPSRLVDITLAAPASRFGMLSYEEFRDIERKVPAFRDVIATGRRGVVAPDDRRRPRSPGSSSIITCGRSVSAVRRTSSVARFS